MPVLKALILKARQLRPSHPIWWLGCGGGIIAACSLSTSSPSIEGEYRLFRLGSLPIPTKITQLPVSPEDPSPSGCWYTLSEGTFEIVVDNQTFEYLRVYRNSCTGGVLATIGFPGSYQQVADSLIFTYVPGSVPRTFSGRVARGLLTVFQDSDTFYYRRK